MEREADVFEFDPVLFGVNSPRFVAQFVAQKHAEKYKSMFTLAAETVLKSIYMDDSMEAETEFYKQVSSKFWAAAGMHARTWLSNVPKMLEYVPSASVDQVDLDKGDLPAGKSLGVLWSPKEDDFKCQTHQPCIEQY